MKATYLLPLCVLCAAPIAHAADNQQANNPQNKTQKPWQGSAELGLISTTGDSDTTNLNTKLNIVQQLTSWRNTYTLTSLYAKSDGNKTSEQYKATEQSDYIFNDHQFWYVRGAYDKNLFSGYQYQASTSTGYGNRFLQEKDGSYLEVSAGVGYRSYKIDENNTTDESQNTPIVRVSMTYNKQLSKTALFKQELSTEVGTDNGTAVNESITSLQANIVGNLAMKLSYTVDYASKVPTGTAHTDTETSVSVLYSF